MVKFGKQYRQLQYEEWQNYYINYKGLKHKIRQMKRVLVQDIKIMGKTSRHNSFFRPILPFEIEKDGGIPDIFKDKKGKHLKEFIDLLFKEFQKCYGFFKKIENTLNQKINSHLYYQTSYSTYNLQDLSKEMKSLSLTIYLNKSLNAFINDNMMAMKKILKKFDKHFSHLFGLITPHIILKLLSKDNSELEYLLQFKVIDEISTIVESIANDLKRYFDQNNEISDSENNKIREEFIAKYNETLKYIKDIDELIYFKTQYKDWVDYISKKKIKKSSKFFENDIFNPILTAYYYKDNLLEKFLSTNDAFNEIKTIQKKITLVNKRNIILILAQSFFYNTLLTCIFPVVYYYEYIRALIRTDYSFALMNIFIFLVVGATYFGQFASIFFFYNYMSIKKIKFSYILSYSFIIIGSLIYILSILYGLHHYKIPTLILGVSRFLIGLGSNPMMGKKYLTLYTPIYLLPILSKIYIIIELCGLIFGPCIISLFSFIYFGKGFCILNCVGYYGILGCIILLIINHFYFVSPADPYFSVVENQTNEDVNMSSSQFENNFDDDDEEDKEFYKMQKEKNEMKKEDLNTSKNDEIQIEVNDNPRSKSNVGFKKKLTFNEKEEDNMIYNKIVENTEENERQSKIVENYYNNNIDTLKYSEVDLSNKERDTIQEIEAKLYEYKEKSNFTYINMIPRTLDDIILNEQKTFGYMNRNFVIMVFLLFINNLIKENLIIYSSYYLLFVVYDIDKNLSSKNISVEKAQKNRGTIQIICLLISAELLLQLISIFFIMPFYKVNLKFKKNLIIFMIASIIFMIPLTFLERPIGVYIPIISIDIFIHKIIEVICSCYLVYLIPPQWKYAHIRASSLPLYLMTLGKMFACVVCFICYNESNVLFKLNQILLICIAFFIYGFLGIIIYKLPNFRVKSLARILSKKAIE